MSGASDTLRRTVAALDAAGARHMIVGSFASEEFSRRQAAELFGIRVVIATAEDTVIAKLVWARESGSERQLRDAAGIVAASGDALDRAHVDRWAAELGLVDLWRRVCAGPS